MSLTARQACGPGGPSLWAPLWDAMNGWSFGDAMNSWGLGDAMNSWGFEDAMNSWGFEARFIEHLES